MEAILKSMSSNYSFMQSFELKGGGGWGVGVGVGVGVVIKMLIVSLMYNSIVLSFFGELL